MTLCFSKTKDFLTVSQDNLVQGRRRKEGSWEERSTNKWEGGRKTKKGRELMVKSVPFVEQSPGKELATRMREALKAMEPRMGFKI